MKKQILVASLAVVSLLRSEPASADRFRIDLQEGFSIPQVLKSWGEPTEKSELEVKRQQIWRYPHGAFVRFFEGQVIEWRHSDQELARRDAALAAASNVSNEADLLSSTDTRDLVQELAREMPGDSQSDSELVNEAIPGTSLMPNDGPLGIAPGLQVIPEGEE